MMMTVSNECLNTSTLKVNIHLFKKIDFVFWRVLIAVVVRPEIDIQISSSLNKTYNNECQ